MVLMLTFVVVAKKENKSYYNRDFLRCTWQFVRKCILFSWYKMCILYRSKTWFISVCKYKINNAIQVKEDRKEKVIKCKRRKTMWHSIINFI